MLDIDNISFDFIVAQSMEFFDGLAILLSKEGKILKIYGEKEKFFDSKIEIINKSISEIFPDNIAKLTNDTIIRVHGNGEKEEIKYQIQKNGKDLQIQSVLLPFQEHYILKFMQKIDDNKELMESQEKYRLITENANDLIRVVDENFFIEYINENAHYKTLGLKKKDLEGKRAIDFVHPEEIKKVESFLKNIIKTGEGIREGKIRDSKGEFRWFEIKGKKYETSLGKKKFVFILRDIHQRKKDKELLELNQFAIDRTAMEVFWINSEAEFIYVNETACKNLGYSYEELTTMAVPDVDPLHDKKIYEEVWEQMKSEGFFTFETQHITNTGEIYPVRVTANYLNHQGKEINFAFAINISTQKEAERKLKESEEKYRHIAELLPDVIFEGDLEGNLTYVNKTGHELFQYTKQDYENGINFFNLVEKGYKKEAINRIERLKKGEDIEPSQYLMIKKDGTKFYTRVHSRPVFRKDKVIGVRGTITDINDMVIAEQKIKESEEKFRTITEQSVVGVLIFKGLKITYVNEAIENILGYPSEEMQALSVKDMFNLVHPKDREKLFRQFKEWKGNQESFKDAKYIIQITAKNGNVKWIEIYAIRITFQGKRGILATIVDITTQKKAENELKHLNKLKSELLRRTSHELKTPLVSIKGFSDLLLELHSRELNSEITSIIKEIKFGCSRLENLIKDILKTAKLETDSIQLVKKPENISSLVKHCVNELKGFIRKRNHQICVNMEENIIVNISLEEIHQVITNLLSNAINYTPPNGLIEISNEQTNNFILIAVKDNGIGITSKEQSQLFTQFGKVERYGQGFDVVSEGTGLGLYISKNIIELHGGEIWMESEGRNKGTTFYFTLPLEVEESDE